MGRNFYIVISSLGILGIITSTLYANPNTTSSNTNWYIGGQVGTSFSTKGNTKIPSIAGRPPLTSEPVYQKGFATNINIGYQFRHVFRMEGEFVYQNLPFHKINNAIGPNTVTQVKNSQTKLFSLFLNGYYDFHRWQSITPYVGAGIGYVRVENSIVPFPPIPVSQNLFFTKKTLDFNTFGYQGIIGLAYHLTKHTQINLNYVYFSTFAARIIGVTNLGPDNYKTRQKVCTNTISIGLRYFF